MHCHACTHVCSLQGVMVPRARVPILNPDEDDTQPYDLFGDAEAFQLA